MEAQNENASRTSIMAGKKRRADDDDDGDRSLTAGAVAPAAADRTRVSKKPRASASAQPPAKHTDNGDDGDDDDAAAARNHSAQQPESSSKLTPSAALSGLRTTSLDALRIVLSDIRAQTALGAGEGDDLIPPTDARQVFAAAVVKGAGDESLHTGRAFFDAWDLAEQRGTPTLVPILQNVLTNLLRLLSMHSPTHPLGDAIIRRILTSSRSSSEQNGPPADYFNRIQGYIAGTQKPIGGGASSGGTSKGFSQDALIISSLRLLAEIVSFGAGRHAREVFDNFNWGLKTLPKLLSSRRRQHASQKRKSHAQQAQPASISRPDTRTAFLIFYLSFLRPLAPSAISSNPDSSSAAKSTTAAKVALLALPGKDFHTPLLKGLAEDAPGVVAFTLEALHSGLLSDTHVPRTSKLGFFNEWNCAHLLALYQRQWETVPNVTFGNLAGSDRLTVAEMRPNRPSVAELTHHFMLSLCTHPGFGICFRDDSWYPRNQHKTGAGVQLDVEADDDDARPTATNTESAAAAGADRSSSASLDTGLYNKVLLGVLRQLVPTRSLPQQELAIRILEACPELVGPYLSSVTSSSPAGVVISLEPRIASSAYIISLAWMKKVFGLPMPSFAAPVPTVKGRKGSVLPPVHEDGTITYRAQPPPLSSILASLLPAPLLSRPVLMRACFHTDRLVRHQAVSLLAVILDRVGQFNTACMRASEAIGEDVGALHRTVLDDKLETGSKAVGGGGGGGCAWAGRCRDVQREARKVLPDLDSFVQAVQSLSQQQQATVSAANGDKTEKPRSNADSLLLEVNLRVLWLYFVAVPHATFDSTFDVGKLLLSRFMVPAAPPTSALDPTTTDNMDTDEGQKAEREAERQIGGLCQLHALRIVNAAAAGFSDSSTDFVRSAVGGGLALSVNSFDVFSRPSTSASASATTTGDSSSAAAAGPIGSNKTYFTALLSIVLTSPSEAVRQTCQNLLRSAMVGSVLFQHDRREWDVWMAAFPRSDSVPGSGTTTTALGSSPMILDSASSLTPDQGVVLAFLDQCLMRTLRTPYRYIETSRRVLSESTGQGQGQDTGGANGGQQLLAGSPLLHTMVEQFCIRCRKRILDAVPAGGAGSQAAVDSDRLALLTFFVRLVVLLLARGVPLVTLRAIASELTGAAGAKESEPTDAISEVCAVFSAELDAVESRGATVRKRDDHGAPREAEQSNAVKTSIKAKIESGSNPAVLLHMDHSAAARFVNTSRSEASLAKLFGAVTALTRAQHGAALAPKQIPSTEHTELLEACLRSGLEDEDLRDVIFRVPAVRALSDDDVEGPLLHTGILIALASSMSPGNPVHKALMASVAVKIVRQLLRRQMAIDVGVLKPAVLLLPYCDDSTLASFAEAMLGKVLGDSKLGKPIQVAALAAVHRSSVLASDQSVASAIVAATIGSRNGLSDPSRLLAPEVMDLVSHALATLTPAGVLAPTTTQRLDGSLQVSVDHDMLEALVKDHAERCASVAMAPIFYHSRRAASAFWRWSLAKGRAGCFTMTSLPNLYAAVEVLARNRAISELMEDTTTEQIENILSGVAGSMFSEEADQSLLAGSIASMLVEARPEMVDQLCTALLSMVPKIHQLAFNRAVIIFCTAAIQLRSDLKPAPKANGSLISLCRKLVSSGLLWIVRRFAEDTEDSDELLSDIAAFRGLLVRSQRLAGLEIPVAAAEPVIEAGITRRWNELEPMRLVEVLCKRTKLGPAGANKVVGRLVAALSTARLQLFVDSAPSELEETWTRTVCAAARQGSEQLSALGPVLAARYRGRLDEDDMLILKLLQECEVKSGQSILATFWSIICQGDSAAFTSAANPGLDMLSSFSATNVLKTCTSFPRWRRLQSYRRPDEAQQRTEQPVIPLDPLFILFLTNAAVADPSFKGLDILTLLRTNAVGVAVCSLSSRCPQLRWYAAHILAKIRTLVDATTFNEKGHLLLILDAAKNAEMSEGEDTEPLPMTTSLFLAHALHAVANPALFTYPLFAHFLLQRPIVDESDVPMLYNMLSSSSDSSAREREWILRFLRDCIRSGGRLEWRIFKRRHVWELICSLYTSQNKSEARNGTVRELMLAVAQLPSAARELLGKKQVLSWVNQAIALEQRPKSVGAPFWLRFTATLLENKTTDEIEKLTQGFWSAAVISVLNQCVPRDPSEGVLGVKALQDAATLCARLVSYLQESNTKAMSLRHALLRVLRSLVAHAAKFAGDAANGDGGKTTTTASSLDIVRTLFQTILSLQHNTKGSNSATLIQDSDFVQVFAAVLRIALVAQLPEARSLAIRHMST
ncbi:unnamed protein product [Tilletia controversa]|nr:unnamed protein product [Tilletia controversa]